MPNKDKLGDFYTSNNELGINSTMSFGNSSVNVSINSTSVVLSPTTSLSANGSVGTSGQLLASNGSGIYWTNPSTFIQQQYTANGTANSFAVTGGYTANQIMVFLNGVKQLAAVDVDLSSGANVGFITTPASGGLIDIYGYKAMAGGSNLGPAFHAWANTTSTTLSAGVNTKVVLETKTFDTASCYNTSTSRFTPNVAGYYQVSAGISAASGPISTNYFCGIYKNGSEQVRSAQITSGWTLNVTGLMYLNGSTDYVELYGYAAPGASVGSSSSPLTFMAAFLARAA